MGRVLQDDDGSKSDNAIRYEATVMTVGPLADEFADGGILVFFGPDAPEELHEFAVITDRAELRSAIRPGDEVSLDNDHFEVLAVGAIANDNLANLGHLVVKFNGLTETELPGDVSLPAVTAPQLRPGSVVRVTEGAS